MAIWLWHASRMLLGVRHDAGTLLREVFCYLSFILEQINSGRRKCGVGAVSSNTSARPKVTEPRSASLKPLNQSLPLDMNHTSVSPPPQQEAARRVKEHAVLICLPGTGADAPTTPRQCRQTLRIILKKWKHIACREKRVLRSVGVKNYN